MQLQEERYPSGALCSVRRVENGAPANGWSVSVYFENGQLARTECWSHGLLIELKTFEEDGAQRAHQIYNHRLKQLVDRPVVQPGNTVRPNIVSGCAHMGFYLRHLPAIAAYIGATYDEDELMRIFNGFFASPMGNTREHSDDGPLTLQWRLGGPEMVFYILFEEGEMLYFWHLRAPDEESYTAARAFMEALPRD
ncbi:MAG: hypothetical protein EOO16_24180 [Chitinophagaceae bacterium]|nr:MAG: hypothetical protein EOO16_24180 [Chitinophagaceae bacterium]